MRIVAFVTGDRNIFYPGILTLLSVKKYNPDFDIIMAMDKTVLNENQLGLLNKYNIGLLDVSSEEFQIIGKIDQPGQFPSDLYLKYVVPDSLKNDYDFAIYLDSDILCINTYELDAILPMHALLAWRRSVKIKGQFVNKEDSKIIENKFNIKLDNELFAANGGFLVFNLSLFEKDTLFSTYIDIKDKIQNIKFTFDRNEIIFGLIEPVLHTKFKILDAIYNFTPMYHNALLNEIKNLHFLGRQKPWKNIQCTVNTYANNITSFLYFNLYLYFLQDYKFRAVFERNISYSLSEIIDITRKYEALYRMKSSDVKNIDSNKNVVRHKEIIDERNRAFDLYSHNNTIRKLTIGTGSHYTPGWFNTDLYVKDNIYYLDLKEKFPFKKNTFDFIYSEHNLEHFTIDEGVFLLKECFSVLKSGGKIRIATPDINKLIAYYQEETETHNAYTKWEFDTFLKKKTSVDISTKCVVFNNFHRAWGHKFIYDFETLKKVLEYVGFTDVCQREISQSPTPELCNLERHLMNSHPEFNRLETMVVEAMKP